MGNIYVTGANGFIGKHLMKALPDAIGVEPKEACCHAPDDTVIHLANRKAKTIGDYMANVATMGGMLTKSVQGGRIVYVSSSVVDMKRPSLYRASKVACESLCSCYADVLRMSVVRPYNVYGPGQPDGFVIPSIINQFLDGKDIIFVDNINARRVFVYVDDVVWRIIDPPVGLSYVGSGPTDIETLIKTIAVLFGRTDEYQVSSIVRPVDIGPSTWTDQGKYMSLSEGLKKTIEYYKQLRVEKQAV